MIVNLFLVWFSLTLPAGIVVWALYSQRKIHRKIQRGDISLLEDSGFTIKRITQGPPGTQIFDNATIAPFQQQQY